MKELFNKILPRTLFGRSLLILITPVLMIQVIATFIFFDRHWEKMTDRLAFSVGGEIAVIADYIENGADQQQIKDIARTGARNLDLAIKYEKNAKIDLDAALQEEAKRSIVVRTLAKAMDSKVRRPYMIDAEMEEKGVHVAVQLDSGVLSISMPQRRLFSTTGYIFLLWMIGTSLIMLAIAILFMRNQIRPIRRLSVVAERIGRGLDIPASFKPEGAREVRQAGRAFIDMHERIRRQIQQRTAMLAGVSHDLRTPLTRMKLQAAMMENTPDVNALKGDIVDMERMLNAYLDFVRGEGGEQSSRTDLTAMLERIGANARRQGGHVEINVAGDLIMPLRPIAFERCLTNLVSNARKYAEQIWITALRTDESVVIIIDDNGPGIPPEQYDEVFKPFVRGEPSRNPSTGGVGLGLPIAQDIVLAHGGHIWLDKSPHGGLRAGIEIPF